MALGVAAAGLAALVALVVPRPLDSDAWWHLSDGDRILDGGLPATDPFSWVARGRPWRLDGWGFDVLAAGIRRMTGPVGVEMLAVAAFVALGVLCIHLARTRGVAPVPAALATVGLMAIQTKHVAERPQALSYVLFAAVALVAPRALDGSRRALVALLGLVVVWVNVHLAFVAGVGLVGLLALAQVVRTRQVGRPAIVAGAAVAVGLLNPYGLGAYTAAFEVRGVSSMIDEWQPLDPLSADAMVLVALAVGALGLVRTGRWRRLDVVLPLAAMAALAVDAVRNTPFLLILLVPEVGHAVATCRPRSVVGRATAHASLAAAATLLALGVAGNLDPPPRYAARAVAAIPAGCRLLNEYGQGGYIIDRRWPDVLVSQDGRNDLYGAAAVTEQAAVLAGGTGWRTWLDDNDVACVLASPERPIVPALVADGWVSAARDEVGVLLVRDAPTSPPAPARTARS